TGTGGRPVYNLGQGALGEEDLLDGLIEAELEQGEPQPASEDGPDVDDARRSIDALIHRASNYGSPREFRELLRFVAHLPKYRPFNRMLVHVQKPGAVYTATAGRWEHEFKRSIRPGARPIVILRPRGPVQVVFDVSD